MPATTLAAIGAEAMRHIATFLAVVSGLLLAADVVGSIPAHVFTFDTVYGRVDQFLALWSAMGAWGTPGVPASALVPRAIGQLPAFLPPLILALLVFVLARLGRFMTRARQPSRVVAGPLQPATREPEFLAAALEILVTPPSPAATWLITLVSAIVISGLAWSYVGRVDIIAVAQGKVQPSGHSKVVQSLDPGRVVAIRVENGSRVSAGDMLLELDQTETVADRVAQARDLASARAEAARRRATIVAMQTASLAPQAIDFPSDTADGLRAREAAVQAADLSHLKAVLDDLDGQIDEKQATKTRLGASITARTRLIDLSRERVQMRRELDRRGTGSRALVIEAQQQLETYLVMDASERAQLAELDSAVVTLRRRRNLNVTQFVAEQWQKIAEVERLRDRIEQELVKAKAKDEHTVLRAPIDGTVQQLAVTTIGQVVSAGQSLMTVVPLEGPIEIEAMIENRDIGFVKVGQDAVVKIEAFPFTRYGTLDATITRVSRDAIDLRDAPRDAQQEARRQPADTGGAAPGQTLVFPATLTLARRTIEVDGRAVPISPGMAVMAEIKTGKRRAIDYVLSPLREVTSGTFRER